jgi:PKD repeat protein
MIFPWVSYSLTTGFATPGDTACVDEPLLFTNTSSGFAMNRMYNRRVTNPGTHGDAFAWGFGDGGSSALAEPTHAYAATGPYSVLLTASITGYATQCSEPAAAPLVIADRPVAAFNTSASIVTVGDTVAFTSVSQGDACTWDFGDGSPAVTSCADQVHVYDSAGTFQVTLTVESRHGCSEVATQSVIVDAPTGVAGTAPTVELQAWPNPVSQGATVHLRWDGNGSAARCTLHDLQGKLLATSATVFGGEADLELPNLPGGLYLLSIEQGALRAHRQLMVAR